MANYHWTVESWGNAMPPTNWEEICSAVNEFIDSLENDETYRGLASERLWGKYCDTGEVCGVREKYD